MTKFEYMEYLRKSEAVKREVSKRLKEKDCEFSDLELKLLNFNTALIELLVKNEERTIPEHIIHNRKTGETIVIWKDGDRTTVKPMEGMSDSEMSSYTAFCACLAKRIYGNNSQVNRIVEMTVEPEKRTKNAK